MKVQVLQEDLNKGINIASRFASTKVQLPVLANILLETVKNKLRISSTNLEVSLSLSIGAKIEKEGSITVPSRIITELINNLKPGQVTLSSEKESLEIKTSEFESTLSGMNPSDFPLIPHNVGSETVKVSTSEFQKVISKVLYSVSTDETRPVLTGVLLIIKKKEIVFVTTDGFRLSQVKLKIEYDIEERRLIIPKNTLSELSRISTDQEIEFSFKKSENQIIFTNSNIVLGSRVIEGEFPDFERIIPKESSFRINLDKDEFLRTIKLASVFARDSANVVKMTIDKGGLELTAESQQFGNQKGKLDIKIDGKLSEKFVIAFNYRFLEEFLNAFQGDDVQMEFSDPNSPVLLLDTKDSTYLHIIMPVRLQE